MTTIRAVNLFLVLAILLFFSSVNATYAGGCPNCGWPTINLAGAQKQGTDLCTNPDCKDPDSKLENKPPQRRHRRGEQFRIDMPDAGMKAAADETAPPTTDGHGQCSANEDSFSVLETINTLGHQILQSFAVLLQTTLGHLQGLVANTPNLNHAVNSLSCDATQPLAQLIDAENSMVHYAGRIHSVDQIYRGNIITPNMLASFIAMDTLMIPVYDHPGLSFQTQLTMSLQSGQVVVLALLSHSQKPVLIRAYYENGRITVHTTFAGRFTLSLDALFELLELIREHFQHIRLLTFI